MFFFLRRTHKWANSTNFVETFFKGNNICWVNPRINQFWAVLSFSKNELAGIWTLDRWLWKKSKNIPRSAQFFHTKKIATYWFYENFQKNPKPEVNFLKNQSASQDWNKQLTFSKHDLGLFHVYFTLFPSA